MKKRVAIRIGGEFRLAISGVAIVKIDGNKIETATIVRPPNLNDSHPPGILKVIKTHNRTFI